MPHIEILQSGKLIRRQAVSREKALAGCGIRLGAKTKITLKLGESTRVENYEVRIVDDTDAPIAETSAATTKPVPRLEGYEIQHPLGEGGMGTVWRGIQLSTNRPVAIKFLAERAFHSEKSQRRFKREVELSAKLEHPNIARIYDSGLRHGAYYYAMELVQGIPLDQYLKDHAADQRATLQTLQTVCHAVQHAHERGVVHRDLKPSNILVDSHGQPHVVDFGLAKSLLVDEDEKQLTISIDGDVTGTPAYMSPEQAAGKVEEIDSRADVFSLGVILYRQLVGQPPHDLSGSRFQVMKRIVEEEMRSPRQLGVKLNADLEGLLRKCLARSPQDRYSNAGQIADDIDNYLHGRPLNARKATAIYRLSKKLSRHRISFALAAVGCGIAAILIVGLLPGGWIRRLTPSPIVIVKDAPTLPIPVAAAQPIPTTQAVAVTSLVSAVPTKISEPPPSTPPNSSTRILHLQDGWDQTLQTGIADLQNGGDSETAEFLSTILGSMNQPDGKTPEALAADLEQMKNHVRQLITRGNLQSAATLNYAQIFTFNSRDYPTSPPNPNNKTGGSANADGMVLYFPCDKPPDGDTVHDESGAGNDGTVFGAKWVPNNRFGGAYQFRLADFTDRIVVPNSDTLNPPHITLSAWVKSDAQVQFWRRIFDKDFHHGYDLTLSGDPHFQARPWFECGQGNLSGKNPLNDVQWHFVAATYDGKNLACYVDGTRNGHGSDRSGELHKTGWDLCIGNSVVDYGWGELLAFDGSITQMRIYNRALSADEIHGLMDSSGSSNSSNTVKTNTSATADQADVNKSLVLHFSLNAEPTNGVVKDESGNGNDGKVIGATLVNDGQRFGYSFRGADKTDAIEVPDSESLHVPQITECAWIKTSQADHWWRRIIDKDWRAAYDLTLGGDTLNGRNFRGKFGMELGNHSVFSNQSIADGQWHHIASTYDGTNMKLYLDGHDLNLHVPRGGNVGSSKSPLRIGNGDLNSRRPDGAPEILAFDGIISDVRIYNRALEPDEIRSLAAPRQILFDGSNLSNWQCRDDGSSAKWPVHDGYMELNNTGDIVTKQRFQDFTLHVEFWCPDSGNAKGQQRANSGVFLQDRYEVQILDSYGVNPPSKRDCGAMWGYKAPDVNACKPPEQWQTYDITFKAARFDADGNRTSKAVVSVIQNGQRIQNDVQLDGPTLRGAPESPDPGPIRLQDYSQKVRFRNIWIIPADHS